MSQCASSSGKQVSLVLKGEPSTCNAATHNFGDPAPTMPYSFLTPALMMPYSFLHTCPHDALQFPHTCPHDALQLVRPCPHHALHLPHLFRNFPELCDRLCLPERVTVFGFCSSGLFCFPVPQSYAMHLLHGCLLQGCLLNTAVRCYQATFNIVGN
jgi:hypothetical protein